jgi:nucleoside-diphosphate-sugar epimerase
MGANRTRDGRFDESSPYHPYGGYGRSKMLMEQSVAEVQRAGRVETVVVRAPWFYGPHQPARQTLFFEMIRDGRVPIVGDGENIRSMVYLDNLCQGLLLAASTPQASGKTYWIADEHPYTMNEIVDTVERLLERSFGIRCAHRKVRLPALTSRIAELMDRTIQGVGAYHQKIHVLSEMGQTIACSIDTAKRELGYRPTVQLEDGMRRSIAWCLEQGLLRADGRETNAPPSPRYR